MTIQTIAGALSAYLLIGMTFTSLYAVLAWGDAPAHRPRSPARDEAGEVCVRHRGRTPGSPDAHR